MMLEFPLMAGYNMLPLATRKVMASHGHLYHEGNLPASLAPKDAFIFGHIHIPVLKQVDDIYVLNPGSVSLPKENHPSTYGILTTDEFIVKTFDYQEYKSIKFE